MDSSLELKIPGIHQNKQRFTELSPQEEIREGFPSTQQRSKVKISRSMSEPPPEDDKAPQRFVGNYCSFRAETIFGQPN